MATIIAGNFEDNTHATDAVQALVGAGVAPDQVCVFFLNPPGQHDQYPVGGDRNESPGARQSDTGALKGAALGGTAGLAAGAVAAATTAAVGPIAVLAGLGVGAYTGSLAGALSKTGRGPEKEAGEPASPPPRRAGMVVAVNTSSAKAPERLAIDILQQHGARDIEQAEGAWVRGRWEDFDPLSPPRLVGAR